MKKIKEARVAFSLIEAFILIIVLGIAVAAATPTITRKIINNQKAGSTLGGANHGRYEVFNKEFLEFSDGDYEKVANTYENLSVRIYEKITDTDTKIEYEEWENSNISEKNSDGVYTQAILKDGRVARRSRRFIFEDNKVTYLSPSGKPIKELNPPHGKRIIESNLTKYEKRSARGNNIWIVEKKPTKSSVKIVPWHRLITGSKTVIDEKIKPDSNGNITFTPPNHASDLIIHAVGGGGAGGTPTQESINNGFQSTFDTNPEVIKQLLNDIRSRVPENARSKINISNGVLKVTLDVRTDHGPYIFPSALGNNYPGLFEFTELLGSPTQVKIKSTPSSWFSWKTLENSQFLAAAVACGGEGGKAGDVIWKTNKNTSDNVRCMWDVLQVDGANQTPFVEASNGCKAKSGLTCSDSTSLSTDCYKRSCKTNIKSPYYTCNKNPDVLEGSYDTSSCTISDADACSTLEWDTGIDITSGPKKYCERNTKIYTHTYKGGQGGDSPGCTYAKKAISAPVQLSYGCTGSKVGAKGENIIIGTDRKLLTDFKIEKDVHGKNGMSCHATVDDEKIMAIGGQGGRGCIQQQTWIDLSLSDEDRAKLTEEELSEIEKYLNDEGHKGAVAYDPLTESVSESYDELVGAEGWAEFSELDSKLDKNIAFKIDYSLTDSAKSGVWDLSWEWMCRAKPEFNCGRDGVPGTITGEKLGSNPGAGIGKTYGIYNYQFVWEIPFATRYFGYGEAGNPGEYATTKISKNIKQLTLHVGKGGKWGETIANTGSKGANGENTTISVSGTNILIARGGKGGKGGLKTGKYDVCYAFSKKNMPKYKSVVNGNTIEMTACDYTSRSTQEIKSTFSKPSKFDDIKLQVTDGSIIGIGLGRGAEGIGSIAINDRIGGVRKVYNSLLKNNNILVVNSKQQIESSPQLNLNKYKNTQYKPETMYKNGADGAIIIVW